MAGDGAATDEGATGDGAATDEGTTDEGATGGSTADGPSSDQPTDSVYLVFDPAPAGYKPFVVDHDTEPTEATVDIWGRRGADDPFVDGDLVMAVFDRALDLDEFGGSAPIEIAGRVVQPLDPHDGASGVAWITDEQTSIVLASVTLDQATVVEMATSLLAGGALDAQGLDQLANDADFFPAGAGSMLAGVTYVHGSQLDGASGQPPAGQPETYRLAADRSDTNKIEAEAVNAWFRLINAADGVEPPPETVTEPIAVGDFIGELTTFPEGDDTPYLELRFDLADGTRVVIAAEATVDELVALAGTVRPATADEVSTMRQTFVDMLATEESAGPNHTTTTTTAPAPSTTPLSTATTGSLSTATTGSLSTATTGSLSTSTTGPPEDD